jgi:hypothetical protein
MEGDSFPTWWDLQARAAGHEGAIAEFDEVELGRLYRRMLTRCLRGQELRQPERMGARRCVQLIEELFELVMEGYVIARVAPLPQRVTSRGTEWWPNEEFRVELLHGGLRLLGFGDELAWMDREGRRWPESSVLQAASHVRMVMEEKRLARLGFMLHYAGPRGDGPEERAVPRDG